MADRHNLSPNPACANDVTGWTSNGLDPTRTDVTGLGFSRQWAAKFTDGSVAFSPQGAASAGLAYTVSVYVRPISFTINGSIFIEFLDSGHNSLAFSSSAFVANTGTVTRISQTDTAPTNAAYARIVITGENYGSNNAYFSQHMLEQSGSLNAWFDGDSTNASWDGTAGSSTSTLSDSVSLPRDVADTLTLADALTSHAGLPRAVSDTLAAPDSLARMVSFPRALADSLTASDAPTRAVSFTRATSDALHLSDACTASVTLARDAADTLNLADTLTRTVGHPRSLADTLTLGDAPTRGAISYVRSTADTLHLPDAVHVEGEALPSLHNLGGSLVATRTLGGSVLSSMLGGSLD